MILVTTLRPLRSTRTRAGAGLIMAGLLALTACGRDDAEPVRLYAGGDIVGGPHPLADQPRHHMRRRRDCHVGTRGDDLHVVTAGGRRHEGIDIFARRGTPVLSATRGVVTTIADRGLGGRQVQRLR